MTRTLALLLTLVLAACVIGFAPGGGARDVHEYKIVRISSEEFSLTPADRRPSLASLGESAANLLAREGWTLEQAEPLWLEAPNNQAEVLWMVFQRPVP